MDARRPKTGRNRGPWRGTRLNALLTPSTYGYIDPALHRDRDRQERDRRLAETPMAATAAGRLSEAPAANARVPSLARPSDDQLQERAQQLRRALRRQQELNRRQHEFILMASHEFGTPLAIIDSHAQGIRRRADRITPDDLVRRIDKILVAVRRMTEMVQRSLDLASTSLSDADQLDEQDLDDGAVDEPHTGRRVEIDLPELLRALCGQYRNLSPEHEIVLDLAELPGAVWGNREHVRQILDNLLSNAIKYSPGGGRIEVTGRREAEAAVIVIRDQGIGIPTRDLPMIFNPFFRASNTTAISGTGYGLALVARLIAQHGGKIDVASGEGQGSTFTVSLPIDLRGGRPGRAVAAGS